MQRELETASRQAAAEEGDAAHAMRAQLQQALADLAATRAALTAATAGTQGTAEAGHGAAGAAVGDAASDAAVASARQLARSATLSARVRLFAARSMRVRAAHGSGRLSTATSLHSVTEVDEGDGTARTPRGSGDGGRSGEVSADGVSGDKTAPHGTQGRTTLAVPGRAPEKPARRGGSDVGKSALSQAATAADLTARPIATDTHTSRDVVDTHASPLLDGVAHTNARSSATGGPAVRPVLVLPTPTESCVDDEEFEV